MNNSLLFSNTRVHSYANIERSVVLPECKIERHASIRNAILDRGVVIPEGMKVGHDPEEDRANGLRITEGGRTLVTAEMLGQPLYHTR